MDNQNKFFFMNPILDALNRGTIIRNIMALLFRVIGVLVFLVTVYFFFKSISYAPDFFYVLMLLIILAAAFLIMQAWFYHAKLITGFEDKDYSVIPIISNLFRAIGETYAILASAIGVGGISLIWFSHYPFSLNAFTQYLFISPYLLYNLIPGQLFSSDFMNGIVFFLSCFITAYGVLLITYFLAENVLVLVDIAKNTKIMSALNSKEKAS